MSDPASPPGPARRRAVLEGLRDGLLFSLLMILAYPPVGWWPVALLAPVPIVWGARRARGTPFRSAVGVAAGSLVWCGWSMHWVAFVSTAGVYPLVLVLGAYTGVAAWLCSIAWRLRGPVVAPIGVAIVWSGWEVVRGEWLFDGFAWFFAAHPLIEWPVLSAPASLGGVYLVSAMLVFVVALAVSAFGQSRRPAVFVAAGAVLVVWLGSNLLSPTVSDERVRVAAVQTDIAQSVRGGWSLDARWAAWEDLQRLTELASGAEPALIAWPETMFPGMAFDPESVERERDQRLVWRLGDPRGGPTDAREVPATAIADGVLELQARTGVPLLVGAAGLENLRFPRDDIGPYHDPERVFNSVFHVENGLVSAERYDKLRLTPFGEVMPYISAWPALERLLLAVGAQGMSFGLTAGDAPVRFAIETPAGELGVATPICFEATSAGVCRRLVFEAGTRRAGLLVNATNDGWFGSWDAGRSCHAMMARWRSVELATPMLRAANTGRSMVIDHRGRIVSDGLIRPEDERSGDGRAGVVAGLVPVVHGATPYARGGHLVGPALTLLSALVVFAGVRTRLARDPAQNARTHPGRTENSGVNDG